MYLSQAAIIAIQKNTYTIEESFFSAAHDKIQQISEEIFEFFLKLFHSEKDIKKIIQKDKEQRKRVLEFLKKQGITEKDINRIVNEIKKDPKKIRELDKILSADIVFKEWMQELKDTTISEKTRAFAALIILLTVMLTLETFLFNITQIFFGPILIMVGLNNIAGLIIAGIAILINTAFFAPIIEETYKKVATKFHLSSMLIPGFAFIEGIKYILPVLFTANPVLIFGAVLARLFAFLMHMFTAYFHKKGQIQKNLINDKIKIDLEKRAYKIGFYIHAAWNALATIAEFINTIFGIKIPLITFPAVAIATQKISSK